MTWPTEQAREAVAQDAVVASGALNDVLAVVRSRFISIEDAWAVLAAALPGVVRSERAAALREAVEKDASIIPDALGYKVRAVFVESLLDRADAEERADG